MDIEFFLPLLAMITLLAVIVFALVSKQKTEERRHDPNAVKSRLAEDAPNK
jgi:H+/Cl- antiporter ClcA